MQIKGVNPEGKERTEEVEDMGKDDLFNLASTRFSKKEISRHIDNLDIESAEVRVALNKMLTVTLDVGKTIVKIGQKILEAVISIIKAYPEMAKGLVLGYFLGLLFASIPILGWIFGSIATPLLALLGAFYGLKADFSNKAVEAKVKEDIREDIREEIRKEVSKFDVLKSEERQGA